MSIRSGRSGLHEALADAPEPPYDVTNSDAGPSTVGDFEGDAPVWPAGPGERDDDGELIETVDLRKVFLALQVQWDVQIEAFKEGVHVDPEQIERLGTQIAGTIRVIQEGQ